MQNHWLWVETKQREENKNVIKFTNVYGIATLPEFLQILWISFENS